MLASGGPHQWEAGGGQGGDRLVEFKDDHTGLGMKTSVKLRLGTGVLYVNGVYWPVQGSVDGNMMRLEDKLQRWLHVLPSNVPPLQYVMDTLMRNVIRQQQSPWILPSGGGLQCEVG